MSSVPLALKSNIYFHLAHTLLCSEVFTVNIHIHYYDDLSKEILLFENAHFKRLEHELVKSNVYSLNDKW